MDLFYFQMGPPYMREVQSPSHQHSDTQSRTPRHELWTRNQLYYLVTLVKSHNIDHGSHEMDHGILQSTLKTADKPFLSRWAAEQRELGFLQVQVLCCSLSSFLAPETSPHPNNPAVLLWSLWPWSKTGHCYLHKAPPKRCNEKSCNCWAVPAFPSTEVTNLVTPPSDLFLRHLSVLQIWLKLSSRFKRC